MFIMFFKWFSVKNEVVSNDSLVDRIKFHNMLLKMKKKRPNFNIDRVMKKLYGSNYNHNL